MSFISEAVPIFINHDVMRGKGEKRKNTFRAPSKGKKKTKMD